MKKIWISVFLLFLVLATSASAEDTFNCGSNVIVLGDTLERVRLLCGPPSSKDVIHPGIEGPQEEDWAYNCGTTGFLYILRFVDGKLESINTDGYGTGQSDCNGASNRP